MHGAADQSHSSHRSEPAGRTGRVDKSVRSRLAKSLTLGGISRGYAVVQLDVTTVNTALSSVGNSLGGGVSELQWVVTAYTIVFAALILTAGALGIASARRGPSWPVSPATLAYPRAAARV